MKVTALGGWSAVGPGEAVTKGDLLISGVYEAEETENPRQNHYAHAHGTVLAQTDYEITVNIPREQSEKVFMSEEEYRSLYFLAWRYRFISAKTRKTRRPMRKRNILC